MVLGPNSIMVVYMDPVGKELSDESDGISCKRLCKCRNDWFRDSG